MHYLLKEFTVVRQQWTNGFSSSQQLLLRKFQQLNHNYYLEKSTVEEYAELLNIAPHHLSQSIKQVAYKNTLTFINDRILSEAKT